MFYVVVFCLFLIFFFISFFVFFFNDTATTEIYTLSLHDALPISGHMIEYPSPAGITMPTPGPRSEEHTSELQSRQYLVCRLLLEKKKNNNFNKLFQTKKIRNLIKNYRPL